MTENDAARPLTRITTSATFSSAHRLHNPSRDEEWNRAVFGKCNNPHGHGHTYGLEITVEGEIDPEKGWVLDFSDLKKLVNERIVKKCDCRNLNYRRRLPRGKHPDGGGPRDPLLGRARSPRRARPPGRARPPRDGAEQGRLQGRGVMRALVSNDDGIHSPGIEALERAAKAAGFETYVVAPDREQSATSHALTLHRPLRVVKTAERSWVVDGTPTDCVNLAICSILRDVRPDFVFSGINQGPNLGDDVTYSGTVAAAFEGTLQGIPSIAFSLDYRRDQADTPPDFSHAESMAEEVIRLALSRPMGAEILWNVNIPAGRPAGIRATRMGRRRYGESVVEKIDPRGRPYFWIGGAHIDTHEDGSDLTTVAGGYVSVTPLHLDLTAYRALEDLADRLSGSRANGASGG